MGLPYSILVVDDDLNALDGMLDMLGEARYLAAGATTFESAKQLLAAGPYHLFISDIRLGAFNGLHLVMRCRIDQPEMAIIIITGYPEPMLELEAGRYGATLLTKPFKPGAFLSAVAHTLASVRRARRWPRKAVARNLAAQVAQQPATIMDVSYGGLRFQIGADAGELPPSFQVNLPVFGLSVQAEPVWMERVASGAWLCGAALTADESRAAHAWRGLVDMLPGPGVAEAR
ncbi:MAG: response regulator [Acidobacteria bacterium]|nr:response regulator [Acidobacteriota bacterium]